MRKLLLAMLLSTAAAMAQDTAPTVSLGGPAGVTGGAALQGENILTHMTDAPYLMVPGGWWAGTQIIPSSLALTASRAITAPLNGGQSFFFCNFSTGGFAVPVGGATGTTVSIPDNKCVPIHEANGNYVADPAGSSVTIGTTNIPIGSTTATLAGLTGVTINLGSNPNAGLDLTGASTYGTHFIIADQYLGNIWYQGVEGSNQMNFIGDYCITNDATWATCQLAITPSGVIPSHIYSPLNCAYVQTTGNPAQCAGETNGSTLILAGSTSVQINTTAVTSGSQIMLTVDASLGVRFPGGTVTCNSNTSQGTLPMYVSARTAGASFTVTTTATSITTNPACFSWMIVN